MSTAADRKAQAPGLVLGTAWRAAMSQNHITTAIELCDDRHPKEALMPADTALVEPARFDHKTRDRARGAGSPPIGTE